LSVKDEAKASAIPRCYSFVLTERPAPPQFSSEIPTITANGMDYTHLCSHGTNEEQRTETTGYYQDLPGREDLLKTLPEAFKQFGEGILISLIIIRM
jgi:hypothetical protein